MKNIFYNNKKTFNNYKDRKMNNNYNIINIQKSYNDDNNYYHINIKNDFCFYDKSRVVGIKNEKNNCYLNSGLQILASCEELVNYINNSRFNRYNIVGRLKEAFDRLLKGEQYDPSHFMEDFVSQNRDFMIVNQCDSQNFIRTLIRNINDICIEDESEIVFKFDIYFPLDYERKEYNKFLKDNEIFPESRIMSLFSGISKSLFYRKCPKCGKEIQKYLFNYFIDQIMYLDEFGKSCLFSDVLENNLGKYNTLIIDCPKCATELEVKEKTTFVKLPEILIFTLARYQGTKNNVKIIPDEKLDMKYFINDRLKVHETVYELFAVNIRLDGNTNLGHEICQVKRNDLWYEINDTNVKRIARVSHFDCSYGLFYRKKKIQIKSFFYMT